MSNGPRHFGSDPRTAGPRRCRVLVVSHNPIVAAGTTALLRQHPGVEVSLHRGDPAGAPPHDVVLCDVAAEAHDASDLDRWTAEDAPVVAMARDVRPGLDVGAGRAGVAAFVSLAADADEIAAALVTAMSTAHPSSERTAEVVDVRRGASAGPGIDLTDRESEILALIASGWSNQEIAQRLFLSINTVKTYIRYAYRKLGISRRSHAVLWCLAHGVTTDERPPQRSPG